MMKTKKQSKPAKQINRDNSTIYGLSVYLRRAAQTFQKAERVRGFTI